MLMFLTLLLTMIHVTRFDHFLLSESMKSNVLLSAVIDNHLYSDHIPLQLTLSLDIFHDKQIELPFEVRQSWYRATNHDIRKYKDNLDGHVDNIVLYSVEFLEQDIIRIRIRIRIILFRNRCIQY